MVELKKHTSLMFVNQHYSLSGSRPLSPAVIELGGIHIGPAKPIESVSTFFLKHLINKNAIQKIFSIDHKRIFG